MWTTCGSRSARSCWPRPATWGWNPSPARTSPHSRVRGSPSSQTRANTRFVNYQATLALARQWGGGDVASVDGLRFVVPVRTINAGPNPHYFHYGAGVTLYSFVSNQFTGFHHMVIPGTDRDSFYILGGPIENVTSLSPVQFISDTAGSSEVIYGLFWLMGFLYSPREADLDEARFWRLDRDADYGALNDLARNRANGRVFVDNWDDLLRVAGSLKTGKVQPMDLIRSLPHRVPPDLPGDGPGRTRPSAEDAPQPGVHRQGRDLPAGDPHCPQPRRDPQQARTQGLPRPEGRAAPALPGGSRGPARRTGPGRQHHRALEHPLHGGSPRPPAGDRLRCA